MKRVFSALASGIIFGAGIAISGMGNPATVLNFFDPLGNWDPSLAFAMLGALIPTAIGYSVLFAHLKNPLFDTQFHLPNSQVIDLKLVSGSALFGIGWGIAGFCPGGAIPALGFAQWPTALFIMSMIGGMLLARYLKIHLNFKSQQAAY